MITNNGKIAFNILEAVYILRTESGLIVNFATGKSCIINSDEMELLVSTEVQESGEPLFIQFSKDVFVNPRKISYLKNNFENKKASKWKITACVPSNHKEEFFVSFDYNERAKAEEFFDTLAKYFP